ncbi:MAG: PadR family transcriptional regulator [Actinomycetota bacterium]
MSKLFGHGDLRLWLLKLIDERPRHGYDIIAGLEEQFLGVYSPSPGTVYPRLSALEQEGLIQVVQEEDGRKIYELTDKGRAELKARTDELLELGDRLAKSARDIARDIRDDVKSAVRDLRAEVRRAAVEVRRDERRASREVRHASRERVRASRVARDVSHEMRGLLRSIQGDLDGFVSDVLSAARRHGLDRDRLEALRRALRDARAAVVEALEGRSKGA